MEGLKSIIETEICDNFNEYIYDNSEEPEIVFEDKQINDSIITLIKNIKELIEDARTDIDTIIYEHSKQYIKDIKADMKLQDKKEADLWN